MHFMAQVLIRLTKMGFITWVADGEDVFKTKIGRFKIRIYETQLPVNRWVFKGKKLEDHWVLEIDDNGHIEESAGRFEASYTPINYNLFREAYHATERTAKTDIERDLFIEIDNTFGIKLLNMEI